VGGKAFWVGGQKKKGIETGHISRKGGCSFRYTRSEGAQKRRVPGERKVVFWVRVGGGYAGSGQKLRREIGAEGKKANNARARARTSGEVRIQK